MKPHQLIGRSLQKYEYEILYNGNLFTKEFKTDEENTIFTKEEHFKLSNDG